MSILVRSVVSVVTVFIIVSAGVTVLLGQAGKVAASAAWVKTPAPGDTSAMAFTTIDNPTMYDIYFTSGATDAAGKVS
jgi:copper(I)-binding protein